MTHPPSNPRLTNPYTTLADAQFLLAQPFPSQDVQWQATHIMRDQKRAVLVPKLRPNAVRARLDEVCPDDWHFEVQATPSTHAVQGRLTLWGVTREAIGMAQGAGAESLKAATDDALVECALLFSVGGYLTEVLAVMTDWDAERQRAVQTPTLPEWALPTTERSAGGQHLLTALEELRGELPTDVELQRTVYKHLQDALRCLRPGGA